MARVIFSASEAPFASDGQAHGGEGERSWREKWPRFGIERRIKSLVRWNAMAMVVRANREESGLGGHISTFASIATLYEVGLNHFFRGPDHPGGGDLVYFQGHAAPGNYARAFLEGRLTESHLENFRRDLKKEGGLSSYPHPWLMPEFWQFPTVSMGLGPILAIYQARFIRYLEDRGILESSAGAHRTKRKVWCFVGDGETDEPETLAALSLAARAGPYPARQPDFQSRRRNRHGKRTAVGDKQSNIIDRWKAHFSRQKPPSDRRYLSVEGRTY